MLKDGVRSRVGGVGARVLERLPGGPREWFRPCAWMTSLRATGRLAKGRALRERVDG